MGRKLSRDAGCIVFGVLVVRFERYDGCGVGHVHIVVHIVVDGGGGRCRSSSSVGDKNRNSKSSWSWRWRRTRRESWRGGGSKLNVGNLAAKGSRYCVRRRRVRSGRSSHGSAHGRSQSINRTPWCGVRKRHLGGYGSRCERRSPVSIANVVAGTSGSCSRPIWPSIRRGGRWSRCGYRRRMCVPIAAIVARMSGRGRRRRLRWERVD